MQIETGRARAPRPSSAPALYPLFTASTALTRRAVESSSTAAAAAGVQPMDRLVCAKLSSPSEAVLVLSPDVLRCIARGRDTDDDATLHWEVPLTHLLLVQQVGSDVQLLVLVQGSTRGPVSSSASSQASAARGPDLVSSTPTTLRVGLLTEEDAGRLHNVLRLAGLNARRAPMPAERKEPMVRATVLREWPLPS